MTAPADGRIRIDRIDHHDPDGLVCRLTIDRPAKANAYTQPMLEALETALAAAETDGTRVIVITGDGDRAFSAGADRTELAQRDWRSVLTLASARVFERLRRHPCVTIAAVNGAAVGGGLELALACDLRVAASTSRFWLPEPEFGLLPAAGGLRWLQQAVGRARASALILGGARWSADDARQNGLVAEVAEPGALDAAVERWIARILARDATALTLAKRALDADSGAFDLTAQALLERTRRPDGRG
jgi:enoyl-CoA hydratase